MLVALPLLGGGWLWLRESPLVAVEHVQITGVAGPEARAIDAALTGAAHRMSTLDMRSGSLLAAVAPFRVVREVHAIAIFPHRLRIRVVEQPPVAALTVGSSRSAVAADGVVLGPALLTSSLPTLSGASQPHLGRRLSNAGLLASLAVLGAAPAPLAKFIARAYAGPMGLTIAMRSGLLVYFGDATRPHAKWLSLARVLADPSSAGASYVDVRLPERPAAGFAGGVLPPADSAAGTAPAGGEQAGDEHAGASEESTVAALAAGLDQAGGVGTSTATTSEPASAGGESGGSASPGGESAGSGGESASSGATPAGQAGAATPEPADRTGAPSGEGTQAGSGGGAPAAGG